MMRIAVFPGSFDPVTKGHKDLVIRALTMFDKIIVAVGTNANKKYMFTEAQRIAWLEETFKSYKQIEIATFTGLTIDYAQSKGAHFLLRGLRNSTDLNFEKPIAEANFQMQQKIESVFLLTHNKYAHISSSIVRDVIKNNGDYTLFVPDAVRV